MRICWRGRTLRQPVTQLVLGLGQVAVLARVPVPVNRASLVGQARVLQPRMVVSTAGRVVRVVRRPRWLLWRRWVRRNRRRSRCRRTARRLRRSLVNRLLSRTRQHLLVSTTQKRLQPSKKIWLVLLPMQKPSPRRQARREQKERPVQ